MQSKKGLLFDILEAAVIEYPDLRSDVINLAQEDRRIDDENEEDDFENQELQNEIGREAYEDEDENGEEIDYGQVPELEEKKELGGKHTRKRRRYPKKTRKTGNKKSRKGKSKKRNSRVNKKRRRSKTRKIIL